MTWNTESPISSIGSSRRFAQQAGHLWGQSDFSQKPDDVYRVGKRLYKLRLVKIMI
jgi:hypothetical protein